MIAQDLLVAQFCADLCSDVRQVVWILYPERRPTGLFRDFVEQCGSVEFLWRSTAISDRVKDANGVELRIRFSHQSLDIFLGVATTIIATIGNDQLCSCAGTSASHLTEPQINGTE